MRRGIIVFLVLMLTGGALFAQGKPGEHKNSLGMVFQIQGLSALVRNDTDGVIFGAGAKFWILQQLALRAVGFFDVTYTTATATTALNAGLSLGGEYHFVKGVVSPYAGLFGGMEAQTMPAPGGIDWHLGAFVGVELTPLEFLSFFVEYPLFVTFSAAGTEVNFGYNTNQPIFGFIIYFN
jgi:hypothetical protein